MKKCRSSNFNEYGYAKHIRGSQGLSLSKKRHQWLYKFNKIRLNTQNIDQGENWSKVALNNPEKHA